MKVRELLKELKKCKLDAEVKFRSYYNVHSVKSIEILEWNEVYLHD
jgi:hypothetical protein